VIDICIASSFGLLQIKLKALIITNNATINIDMFLKLSYFQFLSLVSSYGYQILSHSIGFMYLPQHLLVIGDDYENTCA
jgi:hypothetical protein